MDHTTSRKSCKSSRSQPVLRSSCLKVKTIDESLFSCSPTHSETRGGELPQHETIDPQYQNDANRTKSKRAGWSRTSCESDLTISTEQETIELEQVRSVAKEVTCNGGRRSSVTFEQVEIRTYGTSISINPAVSEGPAIELSWEYSSISVNCSVDEYESFRRRQSSTKSDVPRLTCLQRVDILEQTGYDFDDIWLAWQVNDHIRKLREKTLSKMKAKDFDRLLAKPETTTTKTSFQKISSFMCLVTGRRCSKAAKAATF